MSRRKRNNYLSAKPQPGFIYLVKSPYGYKIGRTKNLKHRLSTFGLVLPFKITLVHALRSTDIARSEWHIHELFKYKRINGEWFDLSDEDIRLFCRIGTEGWEQIYVEKTVNLTEYK